MTIHVYDVYQQNYIHAYSFALRLRGEGIFLGTCMRLIIQPTVCRIRTYQSQGEIVVEVIRVSCGGQFVLGRRMDPHFVLCFEEHFARCSQCRHCILGGGMIKIWAGV